MFFLKGKKVSGNHNNPSEMSHYFLFSAFYLSVLLPYFHQSYDIYGINVLPPAAHAVRRAVFLILE